MRRQELADAQIEVVDRGSAGADHTIAGIEGETLTEDEGTVNCVGPL